MKVLLFGASGQVGSEILKGLSAQAAQIIPITSSECNYLDVTAVQAILKMHRPNLIINAAAYTAVDKAEDEVQLAWQLNVTFVSVLANYCLINQAVLIHFSTDYVFDGQSLEPYLETSPPHPLSVYGQSKLAGEAVIQGMLKHYFIIRISWVFGLQGQNFVKRILELAQEKETLSIVADQRGNPTAAKDVARVVELLIQALSSDSVPEWGLYHYSSEGETTWFDFANAFIQRAKQKGMNLKLKSLLPIDTQAYPTKAMRPQRSTLCTKKIETKLNIKPQPWAPYLDEILDVLMQKECI